MIMFKRNWIDIKSRLGFSVTGHLIEYPTMHYFRNARHTLSMIAFMILTELFLEIQVKCCIVEMLLISHIGIITVITNLQGDDL